MALSSHFWDPTEILQNLLDKKKPELREEGFFVSLLPLQVFLTYSLYKMRASFVDKW